MLAFILSMINALVNFLPVFIIVDYLCPKLWISLLVTGVAAVIFYFLSMIPIAGDIICILLWFVAIPFVIMGGSLPFIIIYFVIMVIKLVFGIKEMIQSKRNF